MCGEDDIVPMTRSDLYKMNENVKSSQVIQDAILVTIFYRIDRFGRVDRVVIMTGYVLLNFRLP